MSYENKYLKYKDKYLNLKKQYGGNYHTITIDYNSAGIIFTDGKHVLAGYQKNRFFSGIGGSKEPSETDPKFTAIREMLEELFGFDEIKNLDESEEKINEKIKKLESFKSEFEVVINNQSYLKNLIKQIDYCLKIEKDKLKLYANKVDIEKNNEKMIQLIQQIKTIPIKKYLYHGKYVNFIIDFGMTRDMLYFISKSGITSKYYDSIPNDIFEIINKRNTDVPGEVSNLALVPIKNIALLPIDSQKILQKTIIFDDYFITDLNKLIENKDIYDIEDIPKSTIEDIPKSTITTSNSAVVSAGNSTLDNKSDKSNANECVIS